MADWRVRCKIFFHTKAVLIAETLTNDVSDGGELALITSTVFSLITNGAQNIQINIESIGDSISAHLNALDYRPDQNEK